jgi:hypothetical protein
MLPAGVTNIGMMTFSDCNSLSSISVDANNKNFTAIDGVLYSKDQKTLLAYPAGKRDTSYIVPAGVTSIGDDAFQGCARLTSVTIPGSVTSIGDDAFRGCESLTSVTFGTGSNIASNNFGSNPFDGYLTTAYNTGKAGTYIRNGGTWTKQ